MFIQKAIFNDHVACSRFLNHEVSVVAKVDGTTMGTAYAGLRGHEEEGKGG